MNIQYFSEYSHSLGREMQFKVYGHGGKPILVIPCQGGRFYEFEDMRMLDIYAPYIESGRAQIFTIDSLDNETLCASGDCRWRICRHEAWINYIVNEAIPRFSGINTEANGWEMKFAVTGLSLGALHAMTLFLRYPDIFDATMCLSGIYTNEIHFGDYHDDLTYANSPMQFLANMPSDHPYMQKYNAGKIIVCVGQGAWEEETLDCTRSIAKIFYEKGINARVEFWGHDVRHDWDWWFIQAAQFLPDLLNYN